MVPPEPPDSASRSVSFSAAAVMALRPLLGLAALAARFGNSGLRLMGAGYRCRARYMSRTNTAFAATHAAGPDTVSRPSGAT